MRRRATTCVERGSARKFMIVCGWSIRAEKKRPTSPGQEEKRGHTGSEKQQKCVVLRALEGNKAEVVTLLGVLDGSVKCMIVVR